MPRRDDVAFSRDPSNIGPLRGRMRLCGLCKTGRLGALACREAIDPDGIEGFGHVKETAPVSLFSPKFLVILSTRRSSCKDVLCLGLKPNSLSRISPRSFTTYNILANTIFLNSLTIVSKRLMGRYEEGSAGSFTGLRIHITRACFHTVGK